MLALSEESQIQMSTEARPEMPTNVIWWGVGMTS